jgi:hypothetical protein
MFLNNDKKVIACTCSNWACVLDLFEKVAQLLFQSNIQE